MIAIIDYDAGNLKNVQKALKYLGYDSIITSDKQDFDNADGIILPGVGNFGDAMDKLRKKQLDKQICDIILSGKPFLGICLGMQLLFEYSEESPGTLGLGIIKGSVKRFPDNMGLKIPHIGFNSINTKPDTRLFAGLNDNPFYYFVHSYYCHCDDRDIVAATADYGITFDCAIEKDNIFAVQFHPEKSGTTGLTTLTNFLKTL